MITRVHKQAQRYASKTNLYLAFDINTEMSASNLNGDIRRWFSNVTTPCTSLDSPGKTIDNKGSHMAASEGHAVVETAPQESIAEGIDHVNAENIIMAAAQPNRRMTRSGNGCKPAPRRNKRVMTTSDSEEDKAMSALQMPTAAVNATPTTVASKTSDAPQSDDSGNSSDSVFFLLQTRGTAQPENANPNTSNHGSEISKQKVKRRRSVGVTKTALQPRQAHSLSKNQAGGPVTNAKDQVYFVLTYTSATIEF
jgi:hypothetical protein